MPQRAAELADALGLDDDELCAIFDADPIAVISGELEQRPELDVLLALLAEPREAVGPAVLRRWVRQRGPSGRPVDLLLGRDFAGFEAAVETLRERGFVLRGGG